MKLANFICVALLSSIIFVGCKTTTITPTSAVPTKINQPEKTQMFSDTNAVTPSAVSQKGGVLSVYATKDYVNNLFADLMKNRYAFDAVKELDPFEYNYGLNEEVTKRSFDNPVLADPHVGFSWNTIPFVIDAATNHLNLGYNNINLPPFHSTSNTPAWYNGGFTYGADNTNRASFIYGQRNDSSRGSFMAAYDSRGGTHDFIFGRSVDNHNNFYNFVFNGDFEGSYNGKGIGTFAVNPIGGIDGFWVGEKTLRNLLDGYISNWEDYTLGELPRDSKSKPKPLRVENAELKERISKLEIEVNELKELLLGKTKK